jgi:hypothetical protein
MADLHMQHQLQQPNAIETQHYQPSPIEATEASLLTTTTGSGESDSQTTKLPQNDQHTSVPTEATTAPLLVPEKAASRLEGWPTSPKPVHSPLWMIIWNGIFDLLLFACATAFLAFAVIVSLYDRASTVENPRTTSMLLNATKYVSFWPLVAVYTS